MNEPLHSNNPADPLASRVPVGGTCPVCRRSDSLVTRLSMTTIYHSCRYRESGQCDWEGAARRLEMDRHGRASPAFTQRLMHLAEQLVDACQREGSVSTHVDESLVSTLRSAIRRIARDRGLKVRTAHQGEGLIEIRSLRQLPATGC